MEVITFNTNETGYDLLVKHSWTISKRDSIKRDIESIDQVIPEGKYSDVAGSEPFRTSINIKLKELNDNRKQQKEIDFRLSATREAFEALEQKSKYVTWAVIVGAFFGILFPCLIF